jgi:magnesium chelatase family protein
MAMISGQLLDRIDLHIEVPAVKYKKLTSRRSGEPSETIRQRVIASRELQTKRFLGRKGMFCTSDMHSRDIQQFYKLDAAGEQLLKMASTKLGLSARAYDRILKVARTIADLAQSPDIRPERINEAI